MSANLEIKARVDSLKSVEHTLQSLPVIFKGVDQQIDTFFLTTGGRLKLRESQIYGTILIPYLRPDQKEAAHAEYQLIPIEDAVTTKRLFSNILGKLTVVEKVRRIYLYENVRIHLDKVNRLGAFIELEGVYDGKVTEEQNMAKIQYLMQILQIRKNQLVEKAYIDLLLEL
ncbi:MAG: CYTH domain-containing protein [Caldithrix sp.]|nr:CYTH domain-containing protein [Caldithrix sp.]